MKGTAELRAGELLTSAERAKVAGLMTIHNKAIISIAKWAGDLETRANLKFLPEPPKDYKNKDQVDAYIKQFEEYYINRGKGGPEMLVPLVAVNSMLEPISVLTIRWRGGAPYVPEGKKIASIETFIVNPELRHSGVGNESLSAALEIAFDWYAGYANRESAREVRVWAFTDSVAGDWTKKIEFFRKFGFENCGNWREFAKEKNLPNEGDRDAMQLKLTRKKWEEMKREHPKLTQHAPIDILNLRIPNRGLHQYKHNGINL